MLHSTQSSGSIEIPMEERTSTPWIRLHVRWAFLSPILPRKYQTRIDVGCVFEFSSQKRDAGGASAPTTLPNHARPYLTSWENRCRGGGCGEDGWGRLRRPRPFWNLTYRLTT